MPLTDPFDLEHNLGRTATQRCTWLQSPGACADGWELTDSGQCFGGLLRRATAAEIILNLMRETYKHMCLRELNSSRA